MYTTEEIIETFLLRCHKEIKDFKIYKDKLNKVFYKAIYNEGLHIPDIYFNGSITHPYSKAIDDVMYELFICGKVSIDVDKNLYKIEYLNSDIENIEDINYLLNTLVRLMQEEYENN